jgi:hypothetical protein
MLGDMTRARTLDISSAVLGIIRVSTLNCVVSAATVIDITVCKSGIAKATPNGDGLKTLSHTTSDRNRRIDVTTASGIVSSECSVAGIGLTESIALNVRCSCRSINFTI